MATIPGSTQAANEPDDYRIEYPTSDGRPMGETDLHRQDMFDLIGSLKHYFQHQRVYVSGNLLICYQPGNKRKHVAPDVFVVKGLDPRPRENYLLWQEGKGPDAVIEVTSKSTRKEDLNDKFELYRDVLKVREYFLFDPRGEYLKPPLQGFRLVDGQFVRIKATDGRLPSEQLGLLLERNDTALRLFDPKTGRWIPTADEARQQAEAACQQAEAACQQAEAARVLAEREIDRLKQALRSQSRPKSIERD